MKDQMDILLAEALHSDEKIDPVINERILKEASKEGGKEYYMKTSERKKNGWKKWAPVAAAIALCIIPVSAYAGSRISTYLTVGSPASEYDSYEDVAKASKKAGFAFDSTERFSNGYTFEEMEIIDTNKMDEDNHKIGTFKEVHMTYKKDDSQEISLFIHEKQSEETEKTNYQETRKCLGKDGVEYDVYYTVDHYKTVPEDYELTEEDKANQEKTNYFISFGSNEVEEMDIAYITWNKDGKDYMMMGYGNPSMDELFAMAEEIL